jgi:hypothetical protein
VFKKEEVHSGNGTMPIKDGIRTLQVILEQTRTQCPSHATSARPVSEDNDVA